jgi:hypothetical protein
VPDNTQRSQAGYPLGGYWATPIKKLRGPVTAIISTIAPRLPLGDSAQFIGSPVPTTRKGLVSRRSFTLFKNFTVACAFSTNVADRSCSTSRMSSGMSSFGQLVRGNDKSAPLDRRHGSSLAALGTDAG